MEVLIHIKHYDDGSEPHKELYIYTMKGTAIGRGKMKLQDTKVEPEDTAQGDLFAPPPTVGIREISYIATLDITKLGE